MRRICLFGPTTVLDPDDGSRVRLQGKHARIVGVLGLTPGHPVSKDRLADLVWEGSPPPSYPQTLDSDVCVLRRRAGLGPGRSSALATTTAGYVLDPDRIEVDLTRATELALQARQEPAAQSVVTSSRVLDLAGGELLEDEPYAAWAVEARTAWAATEAETCLHASRVALVTGDTALGVRSARRALALRPTSETAAVQLMRALWWAGQRGEAIRVFLDLQRSMVEELGEQPGAEARELYLTILGDDGLGQESSGDAEHLRLLLRLLRGALDLTPGVRAPARDAELALAATRAMSLLDALPREHAGLRAT